MTNYLPIIFKHFLGTADTKALTSLSLQQYFRLLIWSAVEEMICSPKFVKTRTVSQTTKGYFCLTLVTIIFEIVWIVLIHLHAHPQGI